MSRIERKCCKISATYNMTELFAIFKLLHLSEKKMRVLISFFNARIRCDVHHKEQASLQRSISNI